MVVDMLLFCLFIIFFLILPSHVAFKIFRLKKEYDLLIEVGLKCGVGIILVTLISIILRFFVHTYTFIWVLPVLSGFYLWKFRNKNIYDYFKMRLPGLLILVVILVNIIAQNLVLFRGGWETNGGFMFPFLHDTMWNISLATELSHHFPPQHPGMAGEPLKNNHFFYPLFLAVAREITHMHIFDLYFRYAPVLVAFLFSVSLYAVSTLFTKRPFFQALTIFLGVWSGNAAFVLPFIFGSSFDWKGSTFFADQPFDQLVNPYSVLGFSFLLFGIYAYGLAIQEEKNTSGWGIIAALFLGSVYGFKSFGGIIALCALIITTGISFLWYRNKRSIFILLLTLSIFIPVFFFITEPGKASLHWAPGWVLTEMVSSRDKLYLPKLYEIEIFYQAIGNTAGYAKIKIIELAIYICGNLGIRLVGLIYLCYLLIRRKTEEKHLLVLVLAATVISFVIPLLFNLGGNAYNIVQFTPYSLLLCAVVTTFFSEALYDFFKKKKHTKIGYSLIVLLVAVAIPANVKNALGKFEPPKDIITHDEMHALTYIKDHTSPDDILLIDPRKYEKDPMFISALSERRIYLASPGFSKQTGRDPTQRMKQLGQFFDGQKDLQVVEKNSIKILYLMKPYKTEQFTPMFTSVYENSSVGIMVYSPS